MANPEHLNILKQGDKAWNAWRKQNPTVRPELTEVNLAGAFLSRANLSRASLADANLSKANLTGADLTGAHLRGGNLGGANLFKANLTGADLTKAHLTKANLTKANLFKTNLTGVTYLTQAQLNLACVDEYTTLPKGLTRLKPCSEEDLGQK